jgi:maltokinase
VITRATTLVDGLAADEPSCVLLVLAVEFSDGTGAHYQLPLGLRRHPPPVEESAVVTEHDDLACYDALADDDLAAAIVELIHQGADVDGVRLCPEADAPGRARPAHVRMISGEQSNSSVVCDDREILKVFRRLWPGTNPDVELTGALRRTGCEHVAPLLGHVEAELDREPTSFAMLQEFADNAVEGWSMGQTSARDYIAETVTGVDEAGGDLTAESERLGDTVADVHEHLLQAFGAEPFDPAAPRASLTERLSEALDLAPDLRPHADAIRAVIAALDQVDAAGAPPAQRVHGDLHLGQVLRTQERWLVIDFEGEPNRSVPARRTPDSPLRDVAGMLRSYDYVAEHQVGEWPAVDGATGPRARRWSRHNRNAFLAGYTARRGWQHAPSVLLRAYELDKALYEIGYEARHRPSWLDIPVRAVRRLAGVDHD